MAIRIEGSVFSDVVYVKQQGAMRTGTNLVKYALEENFTNVRVFMNIGRWKHAPADTPFNWQGTNWEGNGRNVDVATRITSEDLEAFRAAMDAGTVRYAISVRNVYAWIVRYLRRRDHWGLDDVAEIARQWNDLYRSYLSILSDDASSMIFRLEDLFTAFDVTLDRSRLLWGLRRRHAQYVQPERYLRAGVDGESRSALLESSPFNREKYLADMDLSELRGSVLAVVRDIVDEQVVRAYGYTVL